MQDHVGQQLGNYRLIRLLGRGGSAHVYLGEHIYLKTQVAIKVLQERIETRDVESFLKEAQMVAALKHPHILRVLDFGMKGDTPFLVMEYAPGGTLRQKHPLGSMVPLPTVISYVKQVAMALQYAHDKKIVHRDVKPGNMLVEAGDKIVLSDFGIAIPAHQTQSLTTQIAAGTPLYMAPEQIQGKARPASDQYALGVVAYEWLSGTYPFEGESFIEIAMRHVLDSPPPLREMVPNITTEVEQVIMRALLKEPRLRFATIEDFANALEQAYQLTVLALPQSGWSLHSIQEAVTMPLVELLLVYRGHFKEVAAIAWSPDGSCIVSGGRDEMAQVWDVSTGALILTYRGHVSTNDLGSAVGVSAVVWSPIDNRIATAGNDEAAQVWNGTVHIWDASTGRQVLTYSGHFGSVRTIAWSPNGAYIATSGGWTSTVDIWDASTGSRVLTYSGHTSFVHQVAWSPDGIYLASGSDDKTVQIWNASTGVQVRTYDGHSEGVVAVTWSPDGTYIASGSSDGTVHAWDTSTGRQIWHHGAHPDHGRLSLKWSPNGTCIALSRELNSTVELWDGSTGKLILTYSGHSSFIKAIAWSPDGSRIASGDHQGQVHVWQAAA